MMYFKWLRKEARREKCPFSVIISSPLAPKGRSNFSISRGEWRRIPLSFSFPFFPESRWIEKARRGKKGTNRNVISMTSFSRSEKTFFEPPLDRCLDDEEKNRKEILSQQQRGRNNKRRRRRKKKFIIFWQQAEKKCLICVFLVCLHVTRRWNLLPEKKKPPPRKWITLGWGSRIIEPAAGWI